MCFVDDLYLGCAHEQKAHGGVVDRHGQQCADNNRQQLLYPLLHMRAWGNYTTDYVIMIIQCALYLVDVRPMGQEQLH